MNIVILAPGSRGDVQPHIALARALVDRGHATTVIADPVFASVVRANNVSFVAADFDTRSILLEEQETFARQRNPIALLRGLTRRGAEMAHAWSAAAIAPSRDADLIIAAGGAIYMALSLSEATGRPAMQTMLQPFFPTRAFPSPLTPSRHWPATFNLISHHTIHALFYVMFRHGTNCFRADLGLAPWPIVPPRHLRNPAFRALCAVSRFVVAPPADLPPYVSQTGYWFLDDHSGWRPDAALEAFLKSGPPPIFIGFGSMPDKNAAAPTGAILAALDRAGQRAILARGWGGLAAAAQDQQRVITIEEAPHDRLLPRCAGILHHGGAGTTAAAIRAGLPQIIAPVMADQPFWAEQARKLGVAAMTAPKTHLTVESLAAGFRRLGQDTELRQRAAALGQKVQGENGLAAAIALIEAVSPANPAKIR